MRLVTGIALGVMALVSVFGSEPAAAQQLNGNQIEAITAGKVHRGTNPQGEAFVITYGADGALQGALEKRIQHGTRKQIGDRGHWSIAGNKLCVQWSKWRGGTQHCGPVFKNGDVYSYGNGAAFKIE